MLSLPTPPPEYAFIVLWVNFKQLKIMQLCLQPRSLYQMVTQVMISKSETEYKILGGFLSIKKNALKGSNYHFLRPHVRIMFWGGGGIFPKKNWGGGNALLVYTSTMSTYVYLYLMETQIMLRTHQEKFVTAVVLSKCLNQMQ